MQTIISLLKWLAYIHLAFKLSYKQTHKSFCLMLMLPNRIAKAVAIFML